MNLSTISFTLAFFYDEFGYTYTTPSFGKFKLVNLLFSLPVNKPKYYRNIVWSFETRDLITIIYQWTNRATKIEDKHVYCILFDAYLNLKATQSVNDGSNITVKPGMNK